MAVTTSLMQKYKDCCLQVPNKMCYHLEDMVCLAAGTHGDHVFGLHLHVLMAV